MKYLIHILTNQIKSQVFPGKANIVRVESFDNPNIYYAICKEIEQDNRIDKLIIKLSCEKYYEFEDENKTEWEDSLLSLHQGANETYLKECLDDNEYIEKSYVDFSNALTKWRNELSNATDGQTSLLLLMGSEAASDTGGLLDTSYAISPKEIISDLKDDYSNWYDHILDKNGISSKDAKKSIHTLYKAIFGMVNVDLVKFSNFIDSIEDSKFNTIQELIEFICETLNSTWGIPSIISSDSVPKASSLLKGTIGSAKIVTDGINFISRSEDIPTQSAIEKIKRKFDTYAKEKSINLSNPFPPETGVFVNYLDFENTTIEFMQGKNLEDNRKRLLAIDYAYIDKILGTKLPTHETDKVILLSGEPLEIISKILFGAIIFFQAKAKTSEIPTNIRIQVKHISLSDCTKEQKEDSYKKICDYMGGILNFIGESGLSVDGEPISISYQTSYDPFDYINYSEVQDIIKCSGKWGDPSKITFNVYAERGTTTVLSEYKWAFSPNSPWLNAFSYLCNVISRGEDNYVLPSLVVCNNIQDFLDCESEDEFYSQLSQIRDDVLFDKHRSKIRHYFGETVINAHFDTLCSDFKDFSVLLNKHGLFNSLEALRRTVLSYTNLMEQIYKEIDTFSSIQRENLPLIINCFTITSNSEVLTKMDMEEVIVPAYNPVVLEKIDAKILFERAGLCELLENYNENKKNCNNKIENMIQLSSITQAMDVLNQKNNSEYLYCKKMWGYYGIYSNGSIDADFVSGNSFGSTIVADDEDSTAMLHVSPMSKIVVRNLSDYIRTFPARIDGVKIAFVAPEDMQHIVAAIHAVAKDLEKQDIFATFNVEIIAVNSKKNSTSYLRKWLDSYFSDDKKVSVNTFLKNIVINTKDDVDALRPLLKEYDLCFVYDVLKTAGVVFDPSNDVTIDKNMIKFPMTFTPDTIPSTYGKSRKICISQYQFLSTKAQTQVSYVLGNPHSIRGTYKTFKRLELSEISAKIIDLSHECCKWVVCVDPVIDRHMLENANGKIIGFTTGEGSFGELNVTVSARKDILSDIKSMLKKRITEKFSNWDDQRLKTAADYCAGELSQFMDGSRILKALNPYDYEIHSFLAYVLTLQMLGMTETNDKYLLRSLISLDSYKHWFDADDKLRPDFMLLEIPNTNENLSKDTKLKINVKIIECKMGYKKDSLTDKAQIQLEKGIKIMSNHWNPQNSDVLHRYWLNQLYRAIIFTKLNMNDTSEEYNVIREKIFRILDGNFEIFWTGDIFAFWLDSDGAVPDEWSIPMPDGLDGVNVGDLKCHECGQMFIQKMLLPSESRNEHFEYYDISEPEELIEEDYAEDEQEDEVEKESPAINESGETIPSTNQIIVPFLKHLNNGQDHTRRDDLLWYSELFAISNDDKKLKYESNGHPKWETTFDWVITLFRKEGILQNSEVGKYHITEYGERVCELASDEMGENELQVLLEKLRENTQKEPPVSIVSDETSSDESSTVNEESNKTDNAENELIYKKKSLDQVRLLLGKDVRTSEEFYWEFGNKNLNNRHLLINGNSGCGKTYCIQTLLMEAVLQGVSAVVFDYTGGFTSSKLDPVFKDVLGPKIEQRIVKIKKIPINPFEKNEIQIDEDIFVPEEDTDVADKISEIFKAVYGLGDQQKSAIYSAVLSGLKTYGDKMSFPIMVQELENIGSSNAKTVISKIQAFSDFNPFAADDSFSWSSIRDSEGMVYIFQLTGYGRDIQVLLTELLLWDIWNFCVKTGNEDKPFILVMDEAQNLSHTEKSPSAKILTEGRKFGISGWYATQFMKPQLTDDEIQRLQQAGQKLYFCPPDDGVNTVAKNIDITAQGAKEWAEKLQKLQKGECVTCGNMVRNNRWTKYDPRIIKVVSLQERVDKYGQE